MLFIDLDEHDRILAYAHRMYGRRIYLPLITTLYSRLDESKVMTFGAFQRLAVSTHYTNGNIYLVGPIVVVVKLYLIRRIIVTSNVEFNLCGLSPFRLEEVLPVLGDRQLLYRAVFNRVRICERSIMRLRILLTGIGPRKGGSGVCFELTVYIDVLLDLGIKIAPCTVLAGFVLDVSNDIKCRLAGIYIKSNRVCYTVQKSSD